MAVVIRDHEVVVVRRRRDGRTYSVLPGGGVESEETVAQACVRELLEETGLAGRVERQLWRLRHEDRTAVYLLVSAAGRPRLGGGPEEHTSTNSYQPGWVDVARLDDIGLQPAELRGLLRQLVETSSSTR